MLSNSVRKGNDARLVSQLTRGTYALVLAGGRGSRLKQLTDRRSKPAVPFGGKFRIIDFTLSNCVNSGVRRIGVATQYKAQSLIRHLQRGWSFLDGRFDEYIDIMPAQQQVDESKWYQGTADAVFQNLDMIRRANPEYVLILSGDHIYKMDYGHMLAEHVSSGAELTIACLDVPIGLASGFGVMSVDGTGRITAFDEKPAQPAPIPGRPDRALASMGIYIFNANFLYEQLLRDEADSNSSHDFGKDLIPYCLTRYHLQSHDFVDSCVGEANKAPYWRDVGTIDAYWEANIDLTHVIPELNLYDEEWPIWTAQEQLPPTKFVFNDEGRRGAAVDSLTAGGSVISGAMVRRTMLFWRVRVNSYSTVEDSVILPGVEIGRDCKIRRAVIDRNTLIPAGTQIGIDPEADRQRFTVTENGIVLVTPEMLGQEVHSIR